MTAYKVFIVIQLFVITPVVGQSYRFPLSVPTEKFDVRIDSGRISCLFRTSGENDRPSVYRKVFLGEDLRPIDSVDFVVPGNASLRAVESNARYTIYVFYSLHSALQFYGKNDFFQFIVTWKSGKIHSSFVKTAVDVSPYVSAKIKVPNVVRLNFVENTGSPEMFILEFGLYNDNDGVTYIGKTAAFGVDDGKMLWVMDDIFLLRVISTEDKLIGLSSTDSEKKPVYTIHFFSKENGRTLRSQQLDRAQNFRIISTFATNGQAVMIAGTEFPRTNGKDYEKNGHFYMSLLDFEGKAIVEQTDTATRLSSKRMHTLGYVFDRDGNLILIGEGWKKDYSLLGFKITGAIIASLLGESNDIRSDEEITSLFMAKISPEDAGVKDFSTFTIGPWLGFSDVIADGEHVLTKNGNEVLLFDPNEIHKEPVNLTKQTWPDALVLSPYGPITLTRDKKSIVMQLLYSNEQK